MFFGGLPLGFCALDSLNHAFLPLDDPCWILVLTHTIFDGSSKNCEPSPYSIAARLTVSSRSKGWQLRGIFFVSPHEVLWCFFLRLCFCKFDHLVVDFGTHGRFSCCFWKLVFIH